MTTNLVTIAIPVFERTEFFEEALQSALNQTVKCHIVVSDNGSSHNRFEEICNKHAGDVEYHKNAINIGMFPNWNKLVNYTTTPYVTILGDDDILSPFFIENFLETYKKNKKLSVFYTNFKYLIEPSSSEKAFISHNIWGWCTMKDVKNRAMKYDLEFPSICCVVKTDLYKNHPFEERVHGSNDWLSIYSFEDKTCTYGCSKILYTYRKHDKADTRRKDITDTLRLNHLLILSYLALQKNHIWYKLKWLGLLGVFYFHHPLFSKSYIKIKSQYSDIFSNVILHHKILWLISLPIGFVNILIIKAKNYNKHM